MRSAQRGRSTSGVEVTNVSRHGFWLLVDGREIFAAFEQFPWFREASIGDLTRVERPGRNHLYWPTLDVDLAVESLDHPERYPLMSRAGAGQHDPPGTAVRERPTTYTSKRRGNRARATKGAKR